MPPLWQALEQFLAAVWIFGRKFVGSTVPSAYWYQLAALHAFEAAIGVVADSIHGVIWGSSGLSYEEITRPLSDLMEGVRDQDDAQRRTHTHGLNGFKRTLDYLSVSLGEYFDTAVDNAVLAISPRLTAMDTHLQAVREFVGVGDAPAGDSLSVRLRGVQSGLGDPVTTDPSTLWYRFLSLETKLQGMPADWNWDAGTGGFGEETRAKLQQLANDAARYRSIGEWTWRSAQGYAANINDPDAARTVGELRSLLAIAFYQIVELQDAMVHRSISGGELATAAMSNVDPEAILRAYRFQLQKMVQAILEQSKPLEAAAENSALGGLVGGAMNQLTKAWGLDDEPR